MARRSGRMTRSTQDSGDSPTSNCELGTFHGHFAVDVSRAGHLFTGASGSGNRRCSTPSRRCYPRPLAEVYAAAQKAPRETTTAAS